MIKLLKNVANLNNNFQITVTYQLQFLLYLWYKNVFVKRKRWFCQGRAQSTWRNRLIEHVLDNLNIFTSPKLKWEKTTLIFSYSIDGHVMILGSFLKSCFCFDGNWLLIRIFAYWLKKRYSWNFRIYFIIWRYKNLLRCRRLLRKPINQLKI